MRAYYEEASAPERQRIQRLDRLRLIGLPVAMTLSEDDIGTIEKAYATHFERTTWDSRQACYAAIKKMENFPAEQQNSFRCGRLIVEKWKSECVGPEPGDLLVHLAYYRRWTRDTLGALEASDVLNGPRYRSDLKDRDRSVLATERAAALMDLYEDRRGSLGEVERYLKLSFATNGGKNSEHNSNTWGRFERLAGRS